MTRVFSNDQYLDSLASHVENLAVATCGFCYVSNHSTDISHFKMT
mgnify:CR=1 FL=1